MRAIFTRSIVARHAAARLRVAVVVVLSATMLGCLGHAGDADRVRAHPSMNESAKPSNEPMPASVNPGGYGEEYPERRR